MNNTELKPCPWCGGAAEIVTLRKENYGYWPEAIGAKCQSCGATRGGFVVERYDFTAREHVDIRAKAEAKAVASWNTRAAGRAGFRMCLENWGMIFLMEITDEGPSRLEGKSWYGTKEAARKAAVQFLRTRRQNARVTLFTAGPTFWVNPNPEILSDETDVGEDQ